jgi:glycerol uptake facilitator-like aquaporin
MTKYVSEFLGTAFLLIIVVGSGIMGASLSGGNIAIALLANSLATGAGLFILIQCLGPISGAHFNPAVSFIEFLWGRLKKKDLLLYVIAQLTGGIIGVFITHVIFDHTVFEISTNDRAQMHLYISEVVATFGLICTIALAGRKHVEFAPISVAAYITGAYWFTSSTSFANPAVTVARMLTNTFCGIAPNGVVYFIGAQVLGALLAYFLLRNSKLIKG